MLWEHEPQASVSTAIFEFSQTITSCNSPDVPLTSPYQSVLIMSLSDILKQTRKNQRSASAFECLLWKLH